MSRHGYTVTRPYSGGVYATNSGPTSPVTTIAMTTADGSRTLYSERYRQGFHSAHGAVRETRHVFLEGAGVAARLQAGLETRIVEVGFGTGLSAWLSADLAYERGAALTYLALERELLPAALLEPLQHVRHLRHPELLQRYLAWRAALGAAVPDGRYRLELAPGVTLELLIGEAQAQALPRRWANAVYHDAFSPDANPEPWAEAFLARLHGALEPGGILATYTVKGAVRRSLARLGFEVAKRPGPPGGKREVLAARKLP